MIEEESWLQLLHRGNDQMWQSLLPVVRVLRCESDHELGVCLVSVVHNELAMRTRRMHHNAVVPLAVGVLCWWEPVIGAKMLAYLVRLAEDDPAQQHAVLTGVWVWSSSTYIAHRLLNAFGKVVASPRQAPKPGNPLVEAGVGNHLPSLDRRAVPKQALVDGQVDDRSQRRAIVWCDPLKGCFDLVSTAREPFPEPGVLDSIHAGHRRPCRKELRLDLVKHVLRWFERNVILNLVFKFPVPVPGLCQHKSEGLG